MVWPSLAYLLALKRGGNSGESEVVMLVVQGWKGVTRAKGKKKGSIIFHTILAFIKTIEIIICEVR